MAVYSESIKCDLGIVAIRPCDKSITDVRLMDAATKLATVDAVLADTNLCDMWEFKDLVVNFPLDENVQEVLSERCNSGTVKKAYQQTFNTEFTWQSMCFNNEVALMLGVENENSGWFSIMWGRDDCKDVPEVDVIIFSCDPDDGSIKDVFVFLCVNPTGTLTFSFKDFCETGEISESPISFGSQKGSQRLKRSAAIDFDNKGDAATILAKQDTGGTAIPLTAEPLKVEEVKKEKKSDK